MENLDGILRLAEKELEAIVQNGKFRSREEVDSVYKLIDVVKDVYCIWDMEDGSGMSNDGDMSYRSDGYSYARGRGRGAKRDSMGRYSRDGSYGGYSGRSYRGYSRGDRQEYIDHLRDMMEDAPDDQTRQSIQRMIQQMEQS